MFEFAVIGPFAAPRLGVVKQCIECRAMAGVGAPPCPGFGPGCLVQFDGKQKGEGERPTMP
jgi:hypothetical protein